MMGNPVSLIKIGKENNKKNGWIGFKLRIFNYRSQRLYQLRHKLLNDPSVYEFETIQ